MTTATTGKFVPIDVACKVYGCAQGKVRKLAKVGTIGSTVVEGQTLYDVSESASEAVDRHNAQVADIHRTVLAKNTAAATLGEIAAEVRALSQKVDSLIAMWNG